MQGKRLIQTIQLTNLLSFGPESEPIELQPLNVLIGPNGSGKSNLIEAISLVRAAPIDLAGTIRAEGGTADWLWKGDTRDQPIGSGSGFARGSRSGMGSRSRSVAGLGKGSGSGSRGGAGFGSGSGSGSAPIAEVNATITYREESMPLRHRFSFTAVNQRFEMVDEAVEDERTYGDHPEPFFYYRFQQGNPVLKARRYPVNPKLDPDQQDKLRIKQRVRREELNLEQSILSQRKEPILYPEITYLAKELPRIRLYREWNLGRHAPPRGAQPADLEDDFLVEDARNLGLVLNDLENRPGTKKLLIDRLRDFYEPVFDFNIKIQGGTVQIFFHEKGSIEYAIPATRLSDGTLRYLCLLAILCHPDPPPLVCIEEPELGLHPDIMPTIAELLIDASQRTQLIVTTHSDHLVSELAEIPQAVLVCEKFPSGTVMRRLEPERLKEWLDEYTLGDLWRKGEIGGNRW